MSEENDEDGKPLIPQPRSYWDISKSTSQTWDKERATWSKTITVKLIYGGEAWHVLTGPTAEDSMRAFAKELNLRALVPKRQPRTRAEGKIRETPDLPFINPEPDAAVEAFLAEMREKQAAEGKGNE
jgi:hypothetical protein